MELFTKRRRKKHQIYQKTENTQENRVVLLRRQDRKLYGRSIYTNEIYVMLTILISTTKKLIAFHAIAHFRIR